MSLIKAYRNLSPRSKGLFGVGLIAWGIGGLLMTDQAEEKLGLKPSEEDQAQLDMLMPKIRVVDNDPEKKH